MGVKDVQELKSKRGGLKFKITGDVKGKKVTLTKPGDRQIPIISGGDHLTGKVSKAKAKAAEVVEDKDYSVANAAAGASKTVPIRAGEVRKGGYVMLKGKPCKVVEVSISKTGKHGHAKAKGHARRIHSSVAKNYDKTQRSCRRPRRVRNCLESYGHRTGC